MSMEEYSHICEGYNMDFLDPKDIFTYQVEFWESSLWQARLFGKPEQI